MNALQLVLEPIDIPPHVTAGCPGIRFDKALTNPALDGLGAHVEHLRDFGGCHQGLAGHAC